MDDNAKKSEESVNAVKSLLTHRNGFISRVETPDYGVDLNVELVSETSGATSFMFPVQIKSTTCVATVLHDSERFIALPFKTSRLGYLCSRIPVSGIIVLYDDDTQTCYFDYVDAIVVRLDREHGNNDWRSQASVVVHLPLQVLNTTALPAMHRKFSQAHERLQLMVQSQGGNYGLVTHAVHSNAVTPLDLHDSRQVVQVLERLGATLYNQQEFDKLLYLLGRLTSSEINASKAALFLAALTHAQVGNVLDADYYLGRCARQAEEWDASGNEALEFARIRVAFIKGDASPFEYRQKLADLKTHATSPLHRLTFELNVQYLDLLEGLDDEHARPDTTGINDLFGAIEAAPIEAGNKQVLKLFNSDNLHTVGCTQLLRDANGFSLRDKLGISVDPEQRLSRANTIAATMDQAVRTVAEVITYAEAQNEQVLLAQARQYKSKFFLNLEYCRMMLEAGEPVEPVEATEAVHAQYLHHFNTGVAAYTTFLELQLLKDAHYTLGVCYELHLLFHLRYGHSLGGQPLGKLLEVLRGIEKETGVSAFTSAVQPAYDAMNARMNRLHPRVAELSEEEVRVYARKLLEIAELPADRLPFLVAEIEAYQVFARECRNDAVELVSDNRHLQDSRTAYAQPVPYVLRNRRTGECSSPSYNVQELLAIAEQLNKTY